MYDVLANPSDSNVSSSAQSNLDALKDVADAVRAKVAEVRALLMATRKSQFEVGDKLIDLIDNCGCKLSWLAEQLGSSEGTLSQYVSTARAFPEKNRRYDVCFYRHSAVRLAAKRVEQRAKRSTGKEHKIDLVDALNTAVAEDLKHPYEIVKHLRDQARAEMLPDAVADADELAAERIVAHTDGLIGVPHHDDYRKLLPKLPDACIQIAHLDPPYADYAHPSAITHVMAGLSDCDNDNPEGALAVTCDAFPLLARVLAPKGIVLLWQAATALRPKIYEAVMDNGFEFELCARWDKARPQPGYPDSAWTFRTEFCYIIRRRYEGVHNFDGSTRDNLFQFTPVRHDRASLELTHAFEKPIDLCKFLIGKHSNEGHIILDAFGCTGTFCVAAHQLGRRWIYCESNEANYDLGLRRLAKATGNDGPAAIAA